jgi:uncharacterized protein (DUF58 family)
MSRAAGTAALGALCALGAAAFGAPSLYVPGVALVLLGSGAAAWVGLAARGAVLSRTFAGSSVEEGTPLPVRLKLRTGLVPPPGGELLEPLLDAPLALGRRRSRNVRLDVSFSRRGRRRVQPGRLVIRDPLSLARREIVSEPAEVLVLPRIEAVRSAAGDGSNLSSARAGGPTAALEEFELDSLRPYRPGSPASRIHWPTVARTGTMVERRLVADAEARPLVVLDPRGGRADPDALDAAVRAAGSLCVHLARNGGCALLLPGDRCPSELGADLRAWPGLHVRLALVEPTAGAPLLGRAQRSGAVFWVSPSGAGRPPGLSRATAGASFLVTPSGGDGARAAFSVAGCRGYRLGRARGRVAA